MKKRSITIAGHRTSITLEQPFWEQLRLLAQAKNVTVAQLVTQIDATRALTGDLKTNLSSALRLAVLEDLLRRS
jgi:predicted DNA-binding ribbon-helix-helix protein